MKQWFLNLLIAIDQLINVVLNGDPDETLSSRLRLKNGLSYLTHLSLPIWTPLPENAATKTA